MHPHDPVESPGRPRQHIGRITLLLAAATAGSILWLLAVRRDAPVPGDNGHPRTLTVPPIATAETVPPSTAVPRLLPSEAAATSCSAKLARLRGWPRQEGIPEYAELDHSAKASVEADIVTAYESEHAYLQRLQGGREDGGATEKSRVLSRLQSEHHLIKLGAELACLERGYYWILPPGQCFPHNAALYASFPRTWFVYMKPQVSHGIQVQVVFFVPHELFPEIPAIEQRLHEFFGNPKPPASTSEAK